MATGLAEQLREELYSAQPSNQPTFLAEKGVLERYGDRAIKVLEDHYTGIAPMVRKLSLETSGSEHDQRNLKVVIGDTPTVYGTRLGFARKGMFVLPVLYRTPVGKVFGHYDPDTRTLTVHYGVFPEFAVGDPDRRMLEQSGIKYQKPNEVIFHEATHDVQRQTGALARYPRHVIEGLATVATEYLLKKPQSVYRSAQAYAKSLIEKFGFRDAFRGNVPGNYRGGPALQPQPVPVYVGK